MPANAYGSLSGTSMATPHVAGASALVVALESEARPEGVKQLLMSTVDIVDAFDGITVTNGRLNAHRAVSACETSTPMMWEGIASGFEVPTGEPLVIPVSLFDCTEPITGAVVTVTPAGSPAIPARDDGVSPDAVAGDGVYTAEWRPAREGDATLDILADTGADTFVTSVVGTVVEVINYGIEPIPFVWSSLSDGAPTGVVSDDQAAPIDIGFDFDFYGQTHQRVWVSSNGHLTFGNGSLAYENQPIPQQGAPDAMIAPYWDDLNPSAGGTIRYRLDGEAPARRLTVEWADVPYYGGGGRVTFQVTLHEQGDSMVFKYLDVGNGAGHSRGVSATVGVEDGTGRVGRQHSFNQAVISDRTALWVNRSDSDGDGLANHEDNCVEHPNPDQRDSDDDGFGNVCDGDFDQDGVVGVADWLILSQVFGATEADGRYRGEVDMDGNGGIGGSDYMLFGSGWGGSPGPSGLVGTASQSAP
jgi:hypothetical protein